MLDRNDDILKEIRRFYVDMYSSNNTSPENFFITLSVTN